MNFNWGNQNNITKKRKLTIDSSDDENKESDITILKELMKPKQNGKNVSRINNHIYFYGSVNNTNILEMIHNIQDCNEELMNVSAKYNIKAPEIYLHINTYGGSLFAGFAGMDAIKDNPIPVVTIIEGCCASAGTLMSICGSKRLMKKNSYMLIYKELNHEIFSNIPIVKLLLYFEKRN